MRNERQGHLRSTRPKCLPILPRRPPSHLHRLILSMLSASKGANGYVKRDFGLKISFGFYVACPTLGERIVLEVEKAWKRSDHIRQFAWRCAKMLR